MKRREDNLWERQRLVGDEAVWISLDCKQYVSQFPIVGDKYSRSENFQNQMIYIIHWISLCEHSMSQTTHK